jgi:subtilisin family serine protease
MRKFHPSFKHLILVVLAIFLFSQFPTISTTEARKIIPAQKKKKDFNENEVVIQIDSPEKIAEISQRYNLFLTPLAPSGENENVYLAKSLGQEPTQKILKDLNKNPDVYAAQPNYRYKPLSRTPNDQYFSRQWSLFDTSEASGGVSAPSAWDSEAKIQRNVAIAIIDTGVNLDHNDLKYNLTKGSAKSKNFKQPKKKPSDSDGHGTFLAGIIAGKTANKRGISGASFFNHLKVMALKFDFTTSQAITAINFAKAKGVPVINASWGSYGEEGLDLALKDTIFAYPGIVVTASGNNSLNHDGTDPEEKMYPCDFDLSNIICVGASDRNGSLADYSDYGATSIDVAAPGGTDTDELFGLNKKKNNYASAEGSSLSAAFVSAEAGLLISKYPNLSSAQIIEIIKTSVDTSSSLTGKVLSGGKINYKKALDLAAIY